MMKTYVVIMLAVLMLSCQSKTQAEKGTIPSSPAFSDTVATATFAGGCFWCMEPPFEKIDGVIDVLSGYTGGPEVGPTYRQVSHGKTGHMESIQITYDPGKVKYSELLNVFWANIDPTDDGGQFVDRGNQYRSAIFYHTPGQRVLAEATKESLAKSGTFGEEKIVTAIKPATTFYLAEDYHQDYYKTDPDDYHRYRNGSGRDRFIERSWQDVGWRADTVNIVSFSKPPDSVIKILLSPEEYYITQKGGTERAFANAFWDNHENGIYVDIVTGEPLFSSLDKFKSGTGWPSFTRPLVDENVIETDHSLVATIGSEIHSGIGSSHLGHVFSDGPPPTGLRYCIDSGALRFIAAKDLKKEGYGRFSSLFEK